jgi:hypothetical protein
MLGVKKTKVSFLRKLAVGIMKEFPDFKDNIYYQKEYDAEQKRMADMNVKNSFVFMVYFKLLYFYRNHLRRKS